MKYEIDMTRFIAKTKSSDRRRGFITFKNYRIPCVFGRAGIIRQKKEGDGGTPKGFLRARRVYYKRGVVVRPKTKLPIKALRHNDGWCDDPNNKMYNKFVKLPFDGSYENLWRSDNLYNYIVVLDHNIRPVRKGKGSAIFLHVASEDFKPTEGCIAVSEKNMLQLLEHLDFKSMIYVK